MIILKFSSVRWQEETVENLKQNIINSTFSHAVLFCGEQDSCVKLAHACADGLLCEAKNGEACEACPACAKTKIGSHPDKIVISTEKASLGIDAVRECINEMYVRPYSGTRKIFIFENGSKLTKAAQNALLKILENPPSYGVIIIISQKEEDLLPTVISRLKRYTLRIPNIEEVSKYLAEKYPEKRENAKFCAKFCEGNPNEAEELLNRDGDFDFRKRLVIFFNKLAGNEKSAVFDFANYIVEHKDEFNMFVMYMQTILHDLILLKKGVSQNSVINSDMIPALTKLSNSLTEDKLIKTVKNLLDAKKRIEQNASFMLTVNNFLLNTREVLHDRNSRSTF